MAGNDTIVIIFLAMSGACLGSFLNVVIHRLPWGQSIVTPGSRCPTCLKSISWYDNIPVISFLALGGKCRNCSSHISGRYGFVELLTAILFVVLYDAYFISSTHRGFLALGQDWPMFLAHIVLFAALLACSGMDIEHYMINIILPYAAMVVALLAWIGGYQADRISPYVLPSAGLLSFAGCLAAGLALVARALLVRLFWSGHNNHQQADHPDDQEPLITDKPADDNDQSPAKGANITGMIMVSLMALACLGLIVSTIMGPNDYNSFTDRALVCVLLVFVSIVLGCIPTRQSDQLITETIEQERSGARKEALLDLLGLAPAIICALAAVVAVIHIPAFAQILKQALNFSLAGRMPVVGFANWLCGLIIAASFGWLIRIGFTLLFGKEAMGVGDIYMLAAAGCVVGWLAAVVGFFIGAVVGMLGVIILLLWKTTRALSFGPWLSIGVLITTLFYDRIMLRLILAYESIFQLATGHY